MESKEQLSKNSRQRIMVFSCEAGGTDAIIPVLPRLSKKNDLLVYGSSDILIRYEKSGIACVDLQEETEEITMDSLRTFMTDSGIDCVLTDTGAVNMHGRMLWKAANLNQIPSFAILDSWTNYTLRFSNYTFNDIDRFRNNRKAEVFPDYIFAIDNLSEEEMVEEGIPRSRIVVTGQPFFYSMTDRIRNVASDEIADYRKSLGCYDEKKLILYAPDQILFSGQGVDDISYIGYNEYTVLQDINYALDEIDPFSDRFYLVARPHPADINKFWNNAMRSNGDRIPRDFGAPMEIAIASADIVVGMYSTFLVMAYLAGKPTISAQIGLDSEQPLSICRKGLIRCADTREVLCQQIDLAYKGIVNGPGVYNVDSSDPAEVICRYIEKVMTDKSKDKGVYKCTR